jgi:hypothetical protein
MSGRSPTGRSVPRTGRSTEVVAARSARCHTLAMIDLAEPSAPMVGGRRRSRRLLISLVVAAVVIAGGAVTAVSVSLRYLHAPSLATDGGGWLPPDNVHFQSIRAGRYTASVVPPRPGYSQTFEMDIHNPSSVTQTVLGLTNGAELGNAELRAEPEHLTISTKPSFPDNPSLTYSSGPVVIPPHGQFTLRFTHDTGHNWAPCRSEYWNGLSLQVRVGAFTRNEYLDFNSLIMELREPGPGC